MQGATLSQQQVCSESLPTMQESSLSILWSGERFDPQINRTGEEPAAAVVGGGTSIIVNARP
jgi:hypothetical protein